MGDGGDDRCFHFPFEKIQTWGLLGLVPSGSVDKESAPTAALGVPVSVTLDEPALSAPEEPDILGSEEPDLEEPAPVAPEEPFLRESGLVAPEKLSLREPTPAA